MYLAYIATGDWIVLIVMATACISGSHHMTTTLSRDFFVLLEDNKQGNL